MPLDRADLFAADNDRAGGDVRAGGQVAVNRVGTVTPRHDVGQSSDDHGVGTVLALIAA